MYFGLAEPSSVPAKFLHAGRSMKTRQYARCGKISAQYNAYIHFVFNACLTLFKIAIHMAVFLHTFEM